MCLPIIGALREGNSAKHHFVRGKAETEVRFGNLLLLGESADGLIVR